MGNCYYCNKEVDNINLMCIYEGYYCSKICAKKSLTDKLIIIVRKIGELK